MKRLRRYLLLTGILFQSVAAVAELTLPVEPPELYGKIASQLARKLPSTHLLRRPMDDALSAQAWTNYFASLDPQRIYFLASDIETFREHLYRIDDDLDAGNLMFGYQVFDIFKHRVADRADYVSALLDDGIDIDHPEAYAWQRREAPWSANHAAWDDLWRKRIKNEYVQRVVAETLAGESAATNAPAEGEGLSPAAFIEQSYQRMLTLLQDSDEEWVLRRYLSAAANAFDPHTDYMAPSALEDFNIEMKLSLVGIGALLRSEDGAAKVVRLIPGGPADRDKRENRLQPGDRIVGVAQGDGPMVQTLHWPLNKVVQLIRGDKGTKVVLLVTAASDLAGIAPRRVVLERDEVRLEEQAASGKIRTLPTADGAPYRLGVIRLPAFYSSMEIRDRSAPGYRSSADDVDAVLADMRDNVDGVLLDLRNNGGGSLIEAIRLTGLFIPTGPVVQVREGSMIRVLPDRDPRVAYNGPLIVLVNRLSASAAEILAGALQDYGRAVVIGGARTHGKGTVQTILPLGHDPALGALRVTTASYYRISGASTQLRGIEPDILLPSPYDHLDVGEDALPNPIPWSSVRPARYLPTADLDFVIARLTQASLARRQDDERYTTYEAMIERLRAFHDQPTIALDLDTRLTMARSEKELADLRKTLMDSADEADSDEADNRTDLILEESLHILADFVAWRNSDNGAANTAAEASGPRGMMGLIESWLQERL